MGRQKGQSIIIGTGKDIIRIKIVTVRGDYIRIGITADKSVSIHREEIYIAIQREKDEPTNNQKNS